MDLVTKRILSHGIWLRNISEINFGSAGTREPNPKQMKEKTNKPV
jgi:hypothetical protein